MYKDLAMQKIGAETKRQRSVKGERDTHEERQMQQIGDQKVEGRDMKGTNMQKGNKSPRLSYFFVANAGIHIIYFHDPELSSRPAKQTVLLFHSCEVPYRDTNVVLSLCRALIFRGIRQL
jgi:hypothetical protein